MEASDTPYAGKLGSKTHLVVLVSAKKMGLSMQELREFTMQDLMDFADLWSGDPGDKDRPPREATQEDIDSFYRH